jgi:hypothetical protein
MRSIFSTVIVSPTGLKQNLCWPFSPLIKPTDVWGKPDLFMSHGQFANGRHRFVTCRVFLDFVSVSCFDRSYAAVPTQHCRACSNSTGSTGLTRQARAPPARAWAATWPLG